MVADRHIPLCKNILHKPKPPPSKTEVEENRMIRKSAYGGSPQRKYNNPRINGATPY